MSNPWVLYAICALMLLCALAAVVPTILRAAGRDETDADDRRRDDAARACANEALAAEKRRLDEDLREGRIDAALYESMLTDLRRRVLEEQEASLNAEELEVRASRRAASGRLSITRGQLAAIVVSMITFVSAGSYAFLGSPELLELSEAQRVLEGTAPTEAIERYLEIAPKDGRAWVLLAHRRIDAGDFTGAAQAYRNGRASSDKVASDPDVSLEYGAAVFSARLEDMYADANAALAAALAARPGDAKAERLALMGAVAVGEWTRARDILRAMLSRMAPDSADYVDAEQTLRMLEARVAQTEQESAPADRTGAN